MRYWLLKSEPSVYSIDTLKQQKIGVWDGVRSYAARNNLQEMQKGDLAFFYHSSADVIGIAGIAEVARTAYPDPAQFDTQSPYYDAKSKEDRPTWYAVNVRFKQKFAAPITLTTLKQDPKLRDMLVVQKGSRLSVQEVSARDFTYIIKTYT